MARCCSRRRTASSLTAARARRAGGLDHGSHDKGQLGAATLDEISLALKRERPLELFIDAREAVAAAVSVSDDWTRYFSTNRSDFTRVHVLAGSRVVELTVAIAQHLSRTGSLIQIYSDPAIFESRLALACGRG
jgi:hypothetical protein